MRTKGLDLENHMFKVKIAGDGVRFSKSSTFTIFSFAMVDDEERVMSADGKFE